MEAETALTEEEIATIERFGNVLNYPGVQAKLALKLTETRPGLSLSDATDLIERLALSVVLANASVIHNVAHALQMLVDIAIQTWSFPDDFLPDKGTVDKCVRLFWATLRESS